MTQPEKATLLTLDQILENLDAAGVSADAVAVAKRRKITLELMWSRGRSPFQTHARQEFWAILRARDPVAWSYPHIGSLSGHDHTTVMNGVRKVWMREIRQMPLASPPQEKVA